jgi:hypothetical protein
MPRKRTHNRTRRHGLAPEAGPGQRKDKPMQDNSQRDALLRTMARGSAPTRVAAAATKPTSAAAIKQDQIGRDGRVPKNLTEAAPVFGQTRREEKGDHPLLPGAKRPLDDLPLEKNFQGKGNVPTHAGMVTKPVPDDKYRGTHDPQEGNRVLNEAADLGRGKKA